MKKKLVFAFDVSGSVRNEDVLNGYYHAFKLFGKPDKMLVFDTEVKVIKNFKLKNVGGNGTDFSCLERWLKRNKQYQRIVVLTDGYGDTSFKTEDPDKWVWLLLGNKEVPALKFGFAILNLHEARY